MSDHTDHATARSPSPGPSTPHLTSRTRRLSLPGTREELQSPKTLQAYLSALEEVRHQLKNVRQSYEIYKASVENEQHIRQSVENSRKSKSKQRALSREEKINNLELQLARCSEQLKLQHEQLHNAEDLINELHNTIARQCESLLNSERHNQSLLSQIHARREELEALSLDATSERQKLEDDIDRLRQELSKAQAIAGVKLIQSDLEQRAQLPGPTMQSTAAWLMGMQDHLKSTPPDQYCSKDLPAPGPSTRAQMATFRQEHAGLKHQTANFVSDFLLESIDEERKRLSLENNKLRDQNTQLRERNLEAQAIIEKMAKQLNIDL